METPVSEIQVESKEEKKRSAKVSPQDERQEEKTSTLCFKRRKKSAKAVKPKASSEAGDVAMKCPSEAGTPDQPQPPGGTWASIKRLVTRRKRSNSSKQQKLFEAKVQPEINTEDAALAKKKAKSRLKFPCIKLSKGEKRSNHSKIIEDADSSIKVQAEAERLDTKTPTQSDDQATKTKLTPDVCGDVSQKGGDEVCESNVSNSRTSPGEKVISVEVGLDTGHLAIQTGTLILEKDVETTEEEESIQTQQTSPLETSEAEHQLLVVSDAPPSPAIPDQQIVEEARNSILESRPNWKDHENGENVTEEIKPKDTELSQESDFKEIEICAEKPKTEEIKRIEPIAIIITDTEISEFDVKKSKNVPKQFLMSIENEEVGDFAQCGFEGRTSEQYETLLIETASSLVKNAIQLSIEQLVNEMASDDNKINNLLQ
ncbi:A-kinase anchor protein 5 [Pteronotus mesoamericanus]|uniref:A-kinase anchor protein 5 n=1 Tax=Pteronotus mesoamericanus TaxID=1884717 RepID=UPI0023EE2192|nr:A-kinase anchor protein 5 [Pteronotus parnellii mesoamericanus]